jgi:hypothetical protein
MDRERGNWRGCPLCYRKSKRTNSGIQVSEHHSLRVDSQSCLACFGALLLLADTSPKRLDILQQASLLKDKVGVL